VEAFGVLAAVVLLVRRGVVDGEVVPLVIFVVVVGAFVDVTTFGVVVVEEVLAPADNK